MSPLETDATDETDAIPNEWRLRGRPMAQIRRDSQQSYRPLARRQILLLEVLAALYLSSYISAAYLSVRHRRPPLKYLLHQLQEMQMRAKNSNRTAMVTVER